MKVITTAAQTAAAARLAVKSLVIIKIDWPSGTVYYADRDYTFGANTCLGRIVELGSIDSQQKATNFAGLTSVSVTLDDSDSSIKSKVNTDLIEGTPVTVYYHFDSLTTTDAVVMLTGKIQGDVQWSEGERKLSFTADSDSYSNTLISFAPQLTDVAGMSSNAIGRTWPLCFGKPIKVPAVELFRLAQSTIAVSVGSIPSYVLTLEDGSDFAQNTSIQIDVYQATGNFTRCTGVMVGNVFTLSAYNVSVATNITWAARVAGADFTNASVAWITTDTNLVGCYVKCATSFGDTVNYCYKQEGRKCFFWREWRKANVATNILMPGSGCTQIDDARGSPAVVWGVTFEWSRSLDGITWTVAGTTIPDSAPLINGQVVQQVGSTNTYICALRLPETTTPTLLSVYAHRTYRNEKILAQVPSSYFTSNMNQVIGGKNVVAITMTQRLSKRNGENWEDDIYVTLNSSLSQNPATIIDLIIKNYTSLTSDSASLATVVSQLTSWPANFAILDATNVTSVIQSIAYQSRIGLSISANKVYYRYLSILETQNYVITESNIGYQSLNLSFTPTTELVTEYTCIWRKDYVSEEEEYIYKNNNVLFGVKKDEFNFFIYNDLQLVKLSANFWGYRLSNSWRKLRCIVLLPTLGIEVLDTIHNALVDLPTILRGVVDEASFDTAEREISISETLASKSGSLVQDTSFFTGDPAFPVTSTVTIIDPTTGLSLIDYVVPVDPSTSGPNNQDPESYKFIVSCDETVIQRGVAVTVTIQLYNDNNYLVGTSCVATLSVSSSDSADVISVSSVNLTAGVGTASVIVSGGTGIDSLYFTATKGDILGQSPEIKVQDEGTINWITVPLGVQRGENFSVLLQGGAVSASYTLSLTQTDTDILKQGAAALTTITTDASGNYSASDWHFENGLYAINSVKIVLTRAGNTFPSPQLIILSKDPAIGIVYKAAVAAHVVGDVVQPDGSGGWQDGVSATDGRTYGVVGYTDTSFKYIVVRGMVCLGGLTNHTNYYIGATAKLLVNVAGSFVLRSYQGGLCWIGGSSAIASIDDIGDVVITTAAANQVLVYTGTNWVNKSIASADGIAITYPSNVPTFGLTSGGVALIKLAVIDPYSVVCNAGATSLSPYFVTAANEYKVFMRRDSVLDFRFISEDSLEAKAVTYAKIQDTVATSVLGRASASLGVVAPILATADGHVLQRVSGALVFASIATAILPTSGATAGTYGSNTWVAPIITVNDRGLITSVSNTTWTTATDTSTSANTLGFASGVLTLFVGNKVFNANKLMDTGISATAPTGVFDLLSFNGTTWAPKTAGTAANQVLYTTASGPSATTTPSGNYALLTFDGSVWKPEIVGTAANQLLKTKTTSGHDTVAAPVTTGHFLKWDGTDIVWAAGGIPANPADTGYTLIPGTGAAAPVWSRLVELGTGSLTATSTVGSLIVDTSVDGDCFKITTAGLRSFDRSQSTTIPQVSIERSGTDARLYIYDLLTNTGAPTVRIDTSDLTAAYKTYFNGTLTGNIRLREIDVVVAGVAKKMMLLCSLPY